MLVDGVEYKPGKDGRFRCPYQCHNPEYPAPKWKTEVGFAKHLAGCPENPYGGEVWTPPPPPVPEVFGECPDCGETIYKYTSIWQMTNRFVCFDCRAVYQSMDLGFHDCAGFELPGVTLEG